MRCVYRPPPARENRKRMPLDESSPADAQRVAFQQTAETLLHSLNAQHAKITAQVAEHKRFLANYLRRNADVTGRTDTMIDAAALLSERGYLEAVKTIVSVSEAQLARLATLIGETKRELSELRADAPARPEGLDVLAKLSLFMARLRAYEATASAATAAIAATRFVERHAAITACAAEAPINNAAGRREWAAKCAELD